MFELILSLIPLAIAATVQPPQIIALVVLLQTSRGAANGLAYLAGVTAFRLALGGASWILFTNLEGSIETSGGEFSILVGSVLVVLGLLMLVHALRQGFSAQGEDEAAESWLDKLEDVSPVQAFLVGIAFLALDPKDWIIDISVINLIADADFSGLSSMLSYLVYILLAQSLLLIPLVFNFVVPQRAQNTLGNLNAWLKRHDRTIEIVVAMIFSLLFLYIGAENLGVF